MRIKLVIFYHTYFFLNSKVHVFGAKVESRVVLIGHSFNSDSRSDIRFGLCSPIWKTTITGNVTGPLIA